jgi:hypothetical protein
MVEKPAAAIVATEHRADESRADPSDEAESRIPIEEGSKLLRIVRLIHADAFRVVPKRGHGR